MDGIAPKSLMAAAARCAGCGADIPFDADRHVVVCSHCGAGNVVMGRVARAVGRLRPTVDARTLGAVIERYSRERDLGRGSLEVLAREEMWIPFWVSVDRPDAEAARAAVEVPDPAIAIVPHPREEWEAIDPAAAEADAGWPWPTVPADEGEALRYLPFYRLTLRHREAQVEAWVDRASGSVHTSAPLNPDRLRFGGALGWILLGHGAAGVAFPLLFDSIGIALLAYAGLAATLWWPVERLVRRTDADAAEGRP